MTDLEQLAPRPVVQWFAAQMEAKLRANDHKGGWLADSPWAFLGRISAEYQELFDELKAYEAGPTSTHAEAVIAECADVANFAMMVADVVRRKEMNP